LLNAASWLADEQVRRVEGHDLMALAKPYYISRVSGSTNAATPSELFGPAAPVLLTERGKHWHAHELQCVIHEEDAKHKEGMVALQGAHEACPRKMVWMVVFFS
jgi:hypothetical protein